MVIFTSNNPHQLLASLKLAICESHITTWAEINGYFTHTPYQWARKAWFRPSIQGNELRFAIIRPQGGVINREVYAVYHGRFVETMLAHFDYQFNSGYATALAQEPDQVAA